MPFDDRQWQWGVVAELPLYLGGKLSNGIRVTELTDEKTAALLEGTRWQVRFNVTSLYAAAESLDAVDAAFERRISALGATESRLELMVAEGKRPDLDRLKVVEELEGARADRAAAQVGRRKAGALLLSLMGPRWCVKPGSRSTRLKAGSRSQPASTCHRSWLAGPTWSTMGARWTTVTTPGRCL